MLTTLDIRTVQHKNKLLKMIAKLKKDRIDTYYRQSANLRIKCVEYVAYSESINWSKLDKVIGPQRNRLVCSESISLPQNMGYKRFCDDEYKVRLCTNFGIKVLSQCSQNLSVAIIDNDATHTVLPSHLLNFTDNIIVVTQRDDIYKDVADNLLEETGAPIRVAKTQQVLHSCDLIFDLSSAVDVSELDKNAVVMCVTKPQTQCDYMVIYDYTADIAGRFEFLCPEYIDKTYFASALYSMLNVYQLGSLVPDVCSSTKGECTVHSVAELLNNMQTKT